MRVLGLDCGIASVGWAVVEISEAEPDGQIIALGTRMFDTPETDKERRPKSELRRMHRGQRRVIRRRRQRMNAVRQLLNEHGLLPSTASDSLRFQGISPWDVRAKATDKLISADELAVALGHIARHRGFKSNAKSRGENAAEDSKMKKAMAETQEKMAGRTFGQLIATDAAFAGHKRNKEGGFSRTPLRADLEAEVRSIFAAQRRLLNPIASQALEIDFIDKAFFQRGLQDSEHLLAECAFEPDEKRTAKRAYSFELFRYLSRLNTLEIKDGRKDSRITPEELARAMAGFGASKKVSFKALRKVLKLPDTATFGTIRLEDEGDDVTSRHGEAAAGTGTLRGALEGAAWDSLVKTPHKLDRIAEIVSFREDLDNIRAGLEGIGLEPAILEKLMDEVRAGTFDKFTGAGHISAKACRNIIPHLLDGHVYSCACALANYDHTASRERNAFDVGVSGPEALKKILSGEIIDRSLVGSPIARKALIEAVKQVKAVVDIHGVPDAVHIELARDVGKGIDERRKIETGIEKRNVEKDRLRKELCELLGVERVSADELLRFELCKQQNHKCLYSGDPITPEQLRATDNSVQIDHILPWSRFGDDSFNNKTLCTAKANQEKRGRTPFEWFDKNKSEAEWETYVARVQSLPALKGFKRRNYTIKDAKSLEEGFRSRNLNDTSWVCRVLAQVLQQLYPPLTGRSAIRLGVCHCRTDAPKQPKSSEEAPKRRVFTRPGALTDRMRRGWGLQWIKKNDRGERISDDRHHALDAVVVAATTESMMQKLTKAFQEEEAKGSPRDFRDLPEPWQGFRDEVIAAVGGVFVSRAERRRARGEAHAATIRSISERDGVKQVYERKRVADLKLTDLDKVKDAERNAATIASLRTWIEAGKPESAPPLSPKGDAIAKVTLLTNKKPDVIVREGAVDRGEMARVDVFRKKSKAGVWQFYVIPIYPHQIARMDTPPMSAVQANTPESEWPVVDDAYEFCWSLVPMEYLEIETNKGDLFKGYFRGMDRATGAIIISDDKNSGDIVKGIGARTLKMFNKYNVDRLGNLHPIESEKRTWRGKACI
jgi:CRISPR-associated endonuclease Csn1